MSEKSVVAVCGDEALIFGEKNEKTGIRPYVRTEYFSNYGQALEFARDYETPKEKKKKH